MAKRAIGLQCLWDVLYCAEKQRELLYKTADNCYSLEAIEYTTFNYPNIFIFC